MNPSTASSRRGYKVRTVVAVTAAIASAIGGVASAAGATASTPAAHVPWNHLSHGWTMALWTKQGQPGATVYLVGPGGRRFPITKVSASAYPAASAPGGKKVLLSVAGGWTLLNLQSRQRTKLKLPGGQGIAFSRDGRSLLELVDVRHSDGSLTSRLERFGLNGHHEVSYPVRVPGAGLLDLGESPDAGGVGALPLPGGRLAVGATHGVVVLNHNGSVAKRLAPKRRHCAVVAQWRKGVALVSCGSSAVATTLWTVPLAGGPAHRLTAGASKNIPFGYSIAWRYSQGMLGLAPNGCGPSSLVRFDRNGQGHRVNVPSPIGRPGVPYYVGHHGNVVDMGFELSGCAGGQHVLFAYNAVTHTSRALLGGPVNGGDVIAAMPLGN